MLVVKGDTSFAFDVDQTLIMRCDLHKKKKPHKLAIKFNFYGETIWAVPNLEHINLLKASVARGRTTIVWSGNGKEWCAEVLKTLGLDDLDVIVMTKLAGYCDDMPIETYSGNRVYIDYKYEDIK
jgi:hypothetical protein